LAAGAALGVGVAVGVGTGPARAGVTAIMVKLNRDTRNRNERFCRDIDVSSLLARITLLG
jgi:hypothetical protein